MRKATTAHKDRHGRTQLIPDALSENTAPLVAPLPPRVVLELTSPILSKILATCVPRDTTVKTHLPLEPPKNLHLWKIESVHLVITALQGLNQLTSSLAHLVHITNSSELGNSNIVSLLLQASTFPVQEPLLSLQPCVTQATGAN